MERLLSVFLCSAVLLCGAGEKGPARIRLTAYEQVKMKVEADTSNIIEQPRIKSIQPKWKAGSFASKIGLPKQELLWKPAIHAQTGEFRTKATVASPDHSVLVFVEEIGKSPYGSRLIIFDPVDFIYLKYFDISRQITAISLGPNGIGACAVCEQRSMNEKNGVAMLDLVRGRWTGFYPTPKQPATLIWTPSAKGVYVLFEEDPKLYIVGKSGMKAVPEALNIKLLASSPDGSIIGAVTSKELLLINASQGTVEERIELPEEATPFRIEFINNSTLLLSRVQPGGEMIGIRCNVLLIKQGKAREICRETNGIFATEVSGKAFYVGKIVKGRIAKYLLTDLKEQTFCTPFSMRPYSNGKLKDIFCAMESDEMIVLDTMGGISKLKYQKRRWKKTDLIKP